MQTKLYYFLAPLRDMNYAPVARSIIALIYIWFGSLKVLGISPAADLVMNTVPFISGDWVVFLLGMGEVILGVMFLFPQITTITTFLFFIHMSATFLPLVILPNIIWTTFPHALTFQGQDLLKNTALIATVICIFRNQPAPQQVTHK